MEFRPSDGSARRNDIGVERRVGGLCIVVNGCWIVDRDARVGPQAGEDALDVVLLQGKRRHLLSEDARDRGVLTHGLEEPERARYPRGGTASWVR